GFFSTADGLRLYYEQHAPSAQTRGMLVMVHGYGDHAGRYRELGGRLAARGFGALVFDYRGHGQSEGRRAYCDRFAQYVSDLAEACELARSWTPDVPLGL